MNDIKNLYAEWLSLQPLTPENQKRLDRKFMLDFNYNSNHLEGNTLTYGQTELLLMFGKTSGDAPLQDWDEMKAHNVGLELMKREALDKERPLTESFIRELNKTILVQNFLKYNAETGGKYEIHVGNYKTRPNSVITLTGEIFEYAAPEETPAFMTDLVKWYNDEEKKGILSPIELAALLHYRYIRIHPFEDGNGRIARLLVNYVLFRHDYPMIVVKSEEKNSYLDALNKCDVITGLTPSDGANAQIEQIVPFVEFLEDILHRALILGIKAAKGENIDDDSSLDKKLNALKKELGELEGEKAQIPYSPEAVEDIWKKSVLPLLLAWEKILEKFDSILLYRGMSYHIHYEESPYSALDEIKNMDELISNVSFISYKNHCKDMTISLTIKGLKNIDNDRYIVGNMIKIIFYPDIYEIISSASRKTIKKLYHQNLMESEINNIVQDLGNKLFRAIEQIKNENNS